jgi:hypothetical protein
MIIHAGGIADFLGLNFHGRCLIFPTAGGEMKQSEHFLENAENCAQLAEQATDEPTHNRYKRMEAAWRALAAEQDWLDGERSPVRIVTTNSDT